MLAQPAYGGKVQPWDHREPSWLGGEKRVRPGDPGKEGGGDLSLPQLSCCTFPKALKILQDTSSLLISESPAQQLLCVADSNPPAQLSWFQGSPALEAAPISSTGVLEIPQVGAGNEGEVTCRAQHPLGSQQVSFSLSVQSELQDRCWGRAAGAGVCLWEGWVWALSFTPSPFPRRPPFLQL